MTALQESKSSKLLNSLKQIPRGVWFLGLASLLLNLSTIMIFSIMPIYMTVLGATSFIVGLSEGIAEAIALVTRLFSGLISDWIQRRKILIILSYALGALLRPLFPLAPTIEVILIPRFIDRISNGLQATPRDALVGDLAPQKIKGTCFGLRESLGKFGSFIGASIAFMVLFFSMKEGSESADASRNDPSRYDPTLFTDVFWVAVIPAILSVIVLAIFVKDPMGSARDDWRSIRRVPPRYYITAALILATILGVPALWYTFDVSTLLFSSLNDFGKWVDEVLNIDVTYTFALATLIIFSPLIFILIKKLPDLTVKTKKAVDKTGLNKMPKAFWLMILIAAFYFLGRCGEAFLILKGEALHTPIEYIPLIMVGMNFTSSFIAWPVGALSDIIDRRILLMIAFLVMIAAKVVLSIFNTDFGLILGIILWGIQIGMIQSLFVACVADVTPQELRGTGIGVFQLTAGIFAIISGGIAGLMWDDQSIGHETMFLYASLATIVAFLILGAFTLLRPNALKTK